MKLKKTTYMDVLLVLTRDDASPDMGFQIQKGGKGDLKEPIFISRVERGSKAEECGILVGDIVSKVHGVSVKNMTLEQANRLFELDPRNIALKIKRNSESKSSFGSHTSTRSADSAPVTDVTLTPSKKRPHTICIKTSKSTDNSNRTSFVDDNNSDIGGCVTGKTSYASPSDNKMKRKRSIGESCRSFLDRIFRSKSHDQHIQNEPLQATSPQTNSSTNISFSSHFSSYSKQVEKNKKKQSPEIDMALSSPNNANTPQNADAQFQSVINSRTDSASTSSIQNINSKGIGIKTTDSSPPSLSTDTTLEKNVSTSSCSPKVLKGTSQPKAIIQISPSLKILNISSAEDPSVPTTRTIHSSDDCVVLNFSQCEIPTEIKPNDSETKINESRRLLKEFKPQTSSSFQKSANYSVSVRPLTQSAFMNANPTAYTNSKQVLNYQLATVGEQVSDTNTPVQIVKHSQKLDVSTKNDNEVLFISEDQSSSIFSEIDALEKTLKNYKIDVVETLDSKPETLIISSNHVTQSKPLGSSTLNQANVVIDSKLEESRSEDELKMDDSFDELLIDRNAFSQTSKYDTIKRQPDINVNINSFAEELNKTNITSDTRISNVKAEWNKTDKETVDGAAAKRFTSHYIIQRNVAENAPVPPRRNSKILKNDQNLLITKVKTDSEALDEMLDQAITQLQKDATENKNIAVTSAEETVVVDKTGTKSTTDKQKEEDFFNFQYSLTNPATHFISNNLITEVKTEHEGHSDNNKTHANLISPTTFTKEPLILYSRNALTKSKTVSGSEIVGSPDSGFLSPTNDIIDSYVLKSEPPSRIQQQQTLQQQQQKQQQQGSVSQMFQTINDYDFVEIRNQNKKFEVEDLSENSKPVHSNFSIHTDKKLVNIVTPTPSFENEPKICNDKNVLKREIKVFSENGTVDKSFSHLQNMTILPEADTTPHQKCVHQTEVLVKRGQRSSEQLNPKLITLSEKSFILPPSYTSVVHGTVHVDNVTYEENAKTFSAGNTASAVPSLNHSFINVQDDRQQRAEQKEQKQFLHQQEQQQNLYDFLTVDQTNEEKLLIQRQSTVNQQYHKNAMVPQKQVISTDDGIYEQIPAHNIDSVRRQPLSNNRDVVSSTTTHVYNVEPVEQEEFILRQIPLHHPGSQTMLNQNFGTLGRRNVFLDDQPHIRYLSSSSTSLPAHHRPPHQLNVQQTFSKPPVTANLHLNEALKLELKDKLKNVGRLDDSRTAFEREYFTKRNVAESESGYDDHRHSPSFSMLASGAKQRHDAISDPLARDKGLRNLEEELKQSLEEEYRQKKLHLERLLEIERQKKILKEKHEMQSRLHGDHFSMAEKKSDFAHRIREDALYENLELPSRKKMTIYKGKAKVLYNFKAQKPRELSLRKGDTVYLLRRVDKNWYEGEHHSTIGIFPVSYVEVLESIEAVRSLARMKEGSATVLYDFHPRSPLEIPLKKNHVVTLIRRVDDNWYEGRCGEQQGIFPVAYVSTMREPDTPLPTPSATPLPTPSSSRIHTPLPGWQSPSMLSVCPDIPSAPMSPTDFSVCNFSRESTPLGGGSLIGGPTYHPHRPSSVMSEPVVCRDGRIVPHSVALFPTRKNFFIDERPEISRKPPTPSRHTLSGYKQMPPLRSIYDEDEDDVGDYNARSKSLGKYRLESSNRRIGASTLDRPKYSQHYQQRLSSFNHQQPIPKLHHLLPSQRPPLLHQTLFNQQQQQLQHHHHQLQQHQDRQNQDQHQQRPQPPTMTFSSLRFQSPPSYSEVTAGVGLESEKKTNKISFAPSHDKEIQIDVKPILYPRYKALHAFAPRSPEELELHKDDVVRVVEKCKDGWFIGYLESNQQYGLFPGNFVEAIKI